MEERDGSIKEKMQTLTTQDSRMGQRKIVASILYTRLIKFSQKSNAQREKKEKGGGM